MDDATLTKRTLALLGGIPGWAWRETGPPYAGTDVGLFYGHIPPEPDRAVGARIYTPPQSVRGVPLRRMQLRFRGSPGQLDGADVLADAAFDVLDALSRVAGISTVRRESASPLGADTAGREERADNYTIVIDNPEAS